MIELSKMNVRLPDMIPNDMCIARQCKERYNNYLILNKLH